MDHAHNKNAAINDATASDHLLRVVFDSAPNAMAVMQPVYGADGAIEDFSVLLLNEVSLNKRKGLDYKGKRYSQLFPAVTNSGILDRFIEVMTTGVNAIFESNYTGEGMNSWLRFSAVKQADLLVVSTDDITDQKRMENDLQHITAATDQERRIYDSIINATPDLVYVFSPQYKFNYANKALLAMWGKTAEEAIGKGLRENGYEEWHAQMHEREIDEVIATKRSVRGIVSFPHAELGTRVYDYILVPVFNATGEVEVVAGTTRDITDLKNAEESLQQNEARFRNMVEQSPIALMFTKGEDVVIEIVNDPMLGFMQKNKKEEVLGKKMLEALPELEGQPALQTVINVQKTGIPFRGDEQPVDLIVNNKLEHHFFNFSYDLIKDSSGDSGVLHMAVDVTEQVRARRRLEESEAQLKSVIEQTPAPTLVLRGDDFILEHINMPMLQMMGRNSDVIGMPFLSIMPELEGQFAWEQVKKVYAEGIEFDQEEVLVPHMRTGVMQDYYYTVSYRPLREDGEITGMIQVAIDVTESVKAKKALAQSERRFRNLVEQASVATCVLRGKDYIIEVANEKQLEIWGKEASQVINRPAFEAVPEANGQGFQDLLEKVRSGETVEIREMPVTFHRFGKPELLILNFTYQPLFDEDGQISAVMSMTIDVTEFVQNRNKIEESQRRYKLLSQSLEQQVAERTKELQRSNEDLQQFAHVASHDLKEPIRKIKTFSTRLEQNLDGKLDADGHKFLNRIRIATERMFTMIDGVLTYSTTNAGKQISDMADLNQVIGNIETDLEVALQSTGAVLKHTDLPTLEAASVLIYQLFYNLVNNSIKFAKSGVPLHITISSEPVMLNDEPATKIRFADNGIGFEPDQSERIFETFTRLNSKDKYEGTGLGLSLCKKIAERHGGTITAEGIPDEGAIFTIILPLQQKHRSI